VAIIFKKITEEEFNKSALPILFNEATSRRFGEIVNGSNGFRFSWQSDLIEPVITEINKNIYSIGIDQNFAIVNLDENNVLLRLRLTYNFLTTKLYKGSIFVCTELEILRLEHGGNYQVLSSYPLPDFFEDIIFEDDIIKVKCVENDLIERIITVRLNLMEKARM